VAGLLVRWTSFPFDFFSARHSTMRAPGCARQIRRNDMAVITGDANDNVLRGLSGTDSVYGLDGNDTLYGTGKLFGGKGDDTYIFTTNAINPVIGVNVATEIAGEGYDTIIINDTRELGIVSLNCPNVEQYIINGNPWGVGNANITNSIEIHFNATHAAYSSNEPDLTTYSIVTGSGDDTIWGSDFSDGITGGAGADVMLGGKGNDIYEVNVKSDIVIEMGGGGHDTIECTAREYNLPINVEDLHAYGEKGSTGLNFNGNFGNNRIEITGDYDRIVKSWAGDDYVRTEGGNDYLIGGPGNDTLVGGLGNDGYRTDIGNFGKDVIADAGGTDDSVELMGLNPDQIWFSQVGNDLKIYNIDSPTNNVTIQNWFSDPNARVETIYANGKSLEGFRLNDLISVMSDFTRPNSSGEVVNPAVTQAIQSDWR
jgi:Ca2+-binding RTX toxin-like protein